MIQRLKCKSCGLKMAQGTSLNLCSVHDLVHQQGIDYHSEFLLKCDYSSTIWSVNAVIWLNADWLHAVTCQNKFTTPPHQYGCWLKWMIIHNLLYMYNNFLLYFSAYHPKLFHWIEEAACWFSHNHRIELKISFIDTKCTNGVSKIRELT